METKNFLRVALLATAVSMNMTSCSNDDDNSNNPVINTPIEGYEWGADGSIKTCNRLLFTTDGKEDPDGRVIGNGDKEFIFTGKQTLKKGTYLLRGWIYVAEGAELTIEPGTIIKGEKESAASLIVEPGAKLIAQGSAKAPIIFTSAQEKGKRKPGDWGGLIICGRGTNNKGVLGQQIEGGPRTKHGGVDANDNSGILSYVRVEFAGYPFQKDKEINGITFGSVGSGTQVDHVQVSYSNDDSFEWFGGNVNCRYIVAYNGWDDEFDTDNGFSGKVQFALSVRDPRIADTSQSNGFESDNDADGSLTEPFTSATFSNVTFVGPMGREAFENTPDYINGGAMFPQNGSALGKYQAAMQIRRSSRLSCFNSVAVGYPIGLIVDAEKGATQEFAKNGQLKLQNLYFAGMGILGSDANKRYTDDLYDAASKQVLDASQESYSSTFFKAQTGNKYFADAADLKLVAETSLKGAQDVALMPSAGSPLLGAASFSDNLLSSWFEKVDYVGALSPSNNWLTGWTEFDPQNAEY
ncbi:MAG: hypothetical protein Q4B58_07185 [Bacteroidales bacterium]|nr:hypothetical protein [Bacteroidales bacterium]